MSEYADVVLLAPLDEPVRQVGTKAPETLWGSDGVRDFISGNKGKDTIYGLGGEDLLLGGHSDDIVYGGDDNDVLFGGLANDYLDGGNGDDRISGDTGNDLMFGGAGVDTFAFKAGFGRDTIGDFEEGVDKMEFSTDIFADFAAVQALWTQNGADVTIRAADGTKVTVLNTTFAELDAGDFVFV